ncbi:cytoplasmic dynein 2 intermediate chain 2-like [Haemaphysalis longicornis]
MVKRMQWIGDSAEPHGLLSCGLDGMVIQWRYDARKNKLEPINYFLLLAENARLHTKVLGGTSGTYVGVTSLSMNYFDHTLFVMGSEGGGVLEGSLALSKPIAVVDSHVPADRTYNCPVVARFPPHRGHCLDVHSSPFERNLFASAGMDREVKVCSLLQLTAVLSIHLEEPVARVRWSPSQPTLLVALQCGGRLAFYDVRNTATTVDELTPDGKNCTGTSLEFCPRSRDLLFTGCGPGAAQVWQLGSKLAAASDANQKDTVRQLASGSFVFD